MQRFQWRVLPQGMTNSPTLCQKFVSQTISPIRIKPLHTQIKTDNLRTLNNFQKLLGDINWI
jgi:hypothetical protein